MRPLQVALDTRRRDVDRIDSMLVDRCVVEGTFKMLGSGEGSIDINFPVQFIEKPIFNSGYELESGHAPSSGEVPTCTATVIDWKTVKRPGDALYYVGCRVVVRTTGNSTLESHVHVYFHGKHLKNPVRSPDSLIVSI